jgi:hypothetical protein
MEVRKEMIVLIEKALRMESVRIGDLVSLIKIHIMAVKKESLLKKLKRIC